MVTNPSSIPRLHQAAIWRTAFHFVRYAVISRVTGWYHFPFPIIASLLEDDDLVETAATALRAMGATADQVPPLMKVLTDPSNSSGRNFITRHRAAEALAKIRKGSVPALVRVLRDVKLSEGREEAAYALGLIGADADAAVPALIEATSVGRDQNPSLAYSAVLALGLMRGTAAPARNRLLQLTRHRDLGAAAAWALTQLAR